MDTAGFDEPVKHAEVEIIRSNKSVYILLELFANTGYYKYELEGIDRGKVIVAELVSTTDSTIHTNNVAVIIRSKTNGDLIFTEVEAKALDVKLKLILRRKLA